jgi:hypothetical protein
VVGRASSPDPFRRKVAGYQLDSCKPTHYSTLLHMALAKTTLSLKSKLQKRSSMFLLSCDERRPGIPPCFAEHKKMEKLAKATKARACPIPLPTTYYLGLTCHGLDMHAFCVLYDYSNKPIIHPQPKPPKFGLPGFAISSHPSQVILASGAQLLNVQPNPAFAR